MPAATRAHHRILRALVLLPIGLALSCGGDAGQAPAAQAAPPASQPAPQSPCHQETPAPAGLRFTSEPPLTVDTHATYTAVLATNCGSITLALETAQAPHTVNSFVFLAGHKYFDRTPCHRLTTAGIFVLQCGDPTGRGTGGPGYTIPDENLAGATYPAGTVAMANTGAPHSGGSQFFLVYKDAALPPNYTPFAKVSAGMDVLLGIAAQGTAGGGPDGPPRAGVVIDSVTVTKS